MKKRYEAPVLIDAAKLTAASRPERLGVCNTGGSSVQLED